MKIKFSIAILLIFSVVHGQKIALEAQGNGKDVKLFWFCGEWSADMDGLAVKRKSGDGAWQQLGELIKPAVTGEDLSTRTNDAVLVNQLISRRDSALMVKRFEPSDAAKFKDEVLMKEGSLRMLPLVTNFSYLDAMILGFGYWDKNVPASSGIYTYGLFASRNGSLDDEPLYTAEWKYGDKVEPQIPDMSCDKKRLKKERGFQLTWLFEKEYILKKKVRDYVVYKTDTLGNRSLVTENPLRIDMSYDPLKINYLNADYYFKEKATFEVELRDYFDTPRLLLSVKITPEDFPVFPNPKLVISHNSERDQSTTVSWEFPEEYKKFVTSVQIKKGMTPDNMEVINLSPRTTSYVDDQNTKSGVYYYKLKLVTNTGDILFSEPQSIVKYFPLIPPQPIGVSVELEDGNAVLRWEKDPFDEITMSYVVYKNLLNSKEMSHLSYLPTITADSCVIPLGSSFGGIYRFAVRGVSEDLMRSELSDTVQVIVPTEKMPFVEIFPYKKDKNRVTLEWKYPDYVDDLAGFRLYQDGELIADEFTLDATKRVWLMKDLDLTKYTFTLEAVSTSGVLSKMSQERYFTIKEKYE